VCLAEALGAIPIRVGHSEEAAFPTSKLVARFREREAYVELETNKFKATMAEQVAQAARDFQQQRTGHVPKAVTVVLSNDTLVITLQEALTPAEQALAKSAAGAAQVQEFHRQLFASSADSLRREIKRITGVEVREATAEVETTTGTVVQIFTSGTMVQVFRLAEGISTAKWNGNAVVQQS
jgi:uncharacterized protein YbcI